MVFGKFLYFLNFFLLAELTQKIGLAPRFAAFHALLNWKKGKGFVQNNLWQTAGNLPQNDRALAYEIALGTCRVLSDLDEKLKTLMRKLPEEPCKTILEISLYQLLHTRVPRYAVVNSAVDLARHSGLKEGNIKFVNAVLRNASRENFPRVLKSKAPLQWIRVNPQKITAEELSAKLELQEPKILFSRFVWVPNAGDALKNPLFEQGFYSFQNPASFFVAKMCEIKTDSKIWDACAAPGGKTAMLAEENPEAFFVASDCSEKRMEKIFDLQNRLGLKNIQIILANAMAPPFLQQFDCVLVDAPCSNMGVANRRPEVFKTSTKEKIKALSKRQSEILQGASTAVKSGGILLYSVCSQSIEETSDVIEKFLSENSNFNMEESILTSLPDTDRFFIAKLRRV